MSELIAVLRGAVPSVLKRAAAAANAHLRAVGVTPDQAALGAFKREGWDVAGFDESGAPTNDEMRWATAWDGAREQAAKIIETDHGPGDFGLEVSSDDDAVIE